MHLAPCAAQTHAAAANQTWILSGSSALSNSFGAAIFLRQQPTVANAADTGTNMLCLTATNGTKYHSFNDNLDVRACPANTADPHQLWTFDAGAGQIQLPLTTGCVDVHAHDAVNGQVCSVSSPCAPGVWQWDIRQARSDESDDVEGQIVSREAPGFCLAYYPNPGPPAPPAPPPPLPAGSVVVTGLTAIETLRVNEPFAPTEPRPFDPFYGYGSEFDDGGPIPHTRALSGLIYVHNSQVHGTNVRWDDDPTFDSAYSGFIGANEPILTTGYIAPSPHAVLVPRGSDRRSKGPSSLTSPRGLRSAPCFCFSTRRSASARASCAGGWCGCWRHRHLRHRSSCTSRTCLQRVSGAPSTRCTPSAGSTCSYFPSDQASIWRTPRIHIWMT